LIKLFYRVLFEVMEISLVPGAMQLFISRQTGTGKDCFALIRRLAANE